MSLPNWNSDASANKITNTYFRGYVDISGGDLILRNGKIRSATNTIEFDDSSSNSVNFTNVKITGNQKLTFNSVIYDIGEVAFKSTNISFNQSTNTTTFSGTLTFPATSIASTSISNSSFVGLTGNQGVGGQKTFNSQLIMNNNFRMDTGSFLLGTGGTVIITNTQLQLIPNISTLNTKTTNMTYSALTNLTQFTNLLGFTGTLNGFSAVDFGNAITNTLSLTSPAQQQISNLSTDITALNTKTTGITYTSGTSTTNIPNIIFTGKLNNISAVVFSYLGNVKGDIDFSISNLQSQINNIPTFDFSANNVFTGQCKFTNTLQLDSSLLIKTPSASITLTGDNLTRIQYLSNVSSDLNTSITNLNSSVSTLNTKTTDLSYSGTTTTVANTLSSATLTFSGTLNNISTTTFAFLSGATENLQTAINSLKTKTDTTNVNVATLTTTVNDFALRTTEMSYSDDPTPQTVITNKIVLEEVVFTTDLNDITPTTFGYLAGVSSNIQTQLNTKIDSIVGTIIQHIKNDLQTNFPLRFLLCNGQNVSRTTYSNLFSIIGTTYGVGDNSSTFGIPDFQACFLRMASSARTVGGVVYTPEAVGTIQQDSLEAHVHSTGLSGSYLINSTVLGVNHTVGTTRYNTSSFPAFGGAVSTSHRTSTETRPLNHSVYFYITCLSKSIKKRWVIGWKFMMILFG